MTHWKCNKLLALALAVPLLLITGCDDSENEAPNQNVPSAAMSIVFEVDSSSLTDIDGTNISLTEAYLTFQEVEVWSKQRIPGALIPLHSAGERPGAIAMTSEHFTVDLLLSRMEIGFSDKVPVWDFNYVTISLEPAKSGPSDGRNVLIKGVAERGTEQREFWIEWISQLHDFRDFEGVPMIPVVDQRHTEVRIGLDLGEVFRGIDFFTADRDNDGLVVISTNSNPDVHSQFRINMYENFSYLGASLQPR